MRAIVTAVLVLMGVLGSAIPQMWNQVALAEEGAGGPGMMGYRMTPEMMRGIYEMMWGMGIGLRSIGGVAMKDRSSARC